MNDSEYRHEHIVSLEVTRLTTVSVLSEQELGVPKTRHCTDM